MIRPIWITANASGNEATEAGGVYTFEGISPWPIEGLALLFLKERGYK